MSSGIQEQLEKTPEALRPAWREFAANLLHYSGGAALIRKISQRHIFAAAPGAGGTAKAKKWQKVEGPRFAILCYHRIGTGGIPLFSDLPPAVFEAQVKFLRRHYRIVSLSQLCDEIERPSRPPHQGQAGQADQAGQAIAITFDDGYKDLYFEALPILQKYKVPATIFLPVTSIEKNEPLWYDRIFLLFTVFPGDRIQVECDRPRTFALPNQSARIAAAAEVIGWLRTLPEDQRKRECERLESKAELPREMLKDRMLTWDQIREMRAASVEFGAHTLTHPVVSRLTQEQLEHEIVDSKSILEARINEGVQHFAFPFGKAADCGSAAFSVISKAGFRSASITEEGVNGPGSNLLALNRVSLGEERHLPMFALKMAQLFFTSAVTGPNVGMSKQVETTAGNQAGSGISGESKSSYAAHASHVSQTGSARTSER
jgi:peptidoglycan/xylan/chitin deacetylase (PgdA/CDA1 family)